LQWIRFSLSGVSALVSLPFVPAAVGHGVRKPLSSLKVNRYRQSAVPALLVGTLQCLEPFTHVCPGRSWPRGQTIDCRFKVTVKLIRVWSSVQAYLPYRGCAMKYVPCTILSVLGPRSGSLKQPRCRQRHPEKRIHMIEANEQVINYFLIQYSFETKARLG
jgi:hypothetical protein